MGTDIWLRVRYPLETVVTLIMEDGLSLQPFKNPLRYLQLNILLCVHTEQHKSVEQAPDQPHVELLERELPLDA